MKTLVASLLLLAAPKDKYKIRLEIIGEPEEFMFCQLQVEQKTPYLKCVGVEAVKKADAADTKRDRAKGTEL